MTRGETHVGGNLKAVGLHLQIFSAMDHLHYRLNFDLDKNFITA